MTVPVWDMQDSKNRFAGSDGFRFLDRVAIIEYYVTK